MKPGRKKNGTMKRMAAVLAAAALIAGAVLAALAVYKLNTKINNLAEGVDLLRQEMEERISEVSGLLETEKETENIRLCMIPDLMPHTDGWKVTQYGDLFGDQELCYTITTDSGLVIVDGGWEYEVPRLRNIIAEYGNRVDAWILTHYHPDHISAFMEIYKDPQGIEIRKVYAPDFPSLEVLMENASWDDFSRFNEFMENEPPMVQYLHTGDIIDLLGMEMEIFSAYEDEIDQISNDLMNDGSLVFQIRGTQNSMLFCGDAGSANGNNKLSKRIKKRWGEKLKSDYMQMAHHGFGGLNRSFCELVDPISVFFDSPEWLLSGEYKLSCRKYLEWMEEKGKHIYTFYTTPNQILLR